MYFSASPDEGLLEKHLECLPDCKQYFFDYVVPADVYNTFKPTLLKRDAKDAHPRVASRLFVRVIKAMSQFQPFPKSRTFTVALRKNARSFSLASTRLRI